MAPGEEANTSLRFGGMSFGRYWSEILVNNIVHASTSWTCYHNIGCGLWPQHLRGVTVRFQFYSVQVCWTWFRDVFNINNDCKRLQSVKSFKWTNKTETNILCGLAGVAGWSSLAAGSQYLRHQHQRHPRHGWIWRGACICNWIRTSFLSRRASTRFMAFIASFFLWLLLLWSPLWNAKVNMFMLRIYFISFYYYFCFVFCLFYF